MMAKFMLSIGNDSYALLSSEARDRGIKVQELIRAVIIPEWARVNLTERASTVTSFAPTPSSGALGNGKLANTTPSLARVKGGNGNGRGSGPYQCMDFVNAFR